MNNFLSVAKILSFHGIKGEIRAGYTKGKEAQLLALKKMFIMLNEKRLEFTIESIRFHKNFAIIKFKEINSINDVERYKGLHLYASEEFIKGSLEEDEYLVSDLDGLKVYDTEANYLGVISAVGENNAGNLLSIKDNDGKFHMVPFVKELVPVVDLKNKKIVINKIEGLID